MDGGYAVRRSGRRPAAIEVTRAGQVLVRVPEAMPDAAPRRLWRRTGRDWSGMPEYRARNALLRQ